MKKYDFGALWAAFLHWKGWSATAAFFVKSWQAAAAWGGWKRIFCLPFFLVLLLAVLCGAGLAWVFMQGLETRIPAYVLYALSFYCLTALCVQLPGAVRGIMNWLDKHPRIVGLLRNTEFTFLLELYFEQFINFAYGIFKIITGIVVGSAWIGCDGIYNFTQAIIQLFQILRRKNPGNLKKQWRAYRFCGFLVLLMHLSLIGIVFQMVNWNRAEESGEIMIIATALFAFYKFISSFLDIARDRKHTRPIDSSVRMLELSQAIFAIFSLQASMFHTFGTGESWEHLMNLITGCAVCMLIVGIGVYMIRRANREMKKLQEKQHGK